MAYERLDDPAWSEFHDLMHTPFSRYCRRMPGGPLRHLRLWVEYGGPLIWPGVDCTRGRHQWVTDQAFDLPPGEFCLTCLTWRPAATDVDEVIGPDAP